LKLESATVDNSAGESAFHRMRSEFERAWRTHPDRRCESSRKFAGRTARLRLVGDGLSQHIGEAFGHLLIEMNPSIPSLKIDLWDQSATSIACPVGSVSVEPRLLNTTSYVEFGLILASVDDRYIGCQRPQVITWFDRCNQHLVGWVSDHNELSIYDRGKPLHLPLLLWHSDQDTEVIHGAVVAKNGEGVLLAGRGGTGKSTAALTCVEAGFDYLGDDYIGLEMSADGSFRGHSLYSATWLMSDHLMRFPRLIPYAIFPERPERDKTLVLLSQVFPQQLLRSATICALVLPRITANPTAQIRPASKAEALFALAPTSILLRPRAGAATLNKLACLAERVPCYWLDLGRNLSETHVRLAQVMDFAPAGQPN
jgi:hypothetical protein